MRTLKASTLQIGKPYIMEIVDADGSEAPVTIISKPEVAINQMSDKDAFIIATPFGNIHAVRNNTAPHFLVTQKGNKMCRMRFRAMEQENITLSPPPPKTGQRGRTKPVATPPGYIPKGVRRTR